MGQIWKVRLKTGRILSGPLAIWEIYSWTKEIEGHKLESAECCRRR